MNPAGWWRGLQNNPVYLREKGQWGEANPYYDLLRRYSPFVIMGVVILGACTGISNPAIFSENDALIIFWCLLCLPGILLSALTLFGSFMVPALTAPTVSYEVAQGTWEILRVTPMPMRTIMMAKMLGALARLRLLWRLLFVASMFQGLMMACSTSIAGGDYAIWGWLVGLSTLIRPWLEVGFAGFTGMLLSTLTRSATMALVGSYSAVALVKLFNNGLLWTAVATLFKLDEFILLMGPLATTLIYGVATAGVAAGLVHSANRLDYA